MLTNERKKELQNDLQRARRFDPADFAIWGKGEYNYVLHLLKTEKKSIK